MARIDYLNDPDAPAANSLVPSVDVVVTDDAGRILLIQRADNGNWALPGGGIDIGESLGEAAVREVREETGIRCTITGLVGIYTNPDHRIEYTSNGEVRQEFTIVLTGQPVSGQPTPSDETSQVVWAERDALGKYHMHPSMRRRVDHYLSGQATPYLG